MRLVAGGLVAAALLTLPIDQALSRAIRALPITNDPARELEFLGQFGQLSSVVLAFVLIALLDPGKWRRLFDWALAAGLVWMLTMSLKVGLGRARPRVEALDGRFFGPLRWVDLGETRGRALDWDQAASSDLWSMPSNHAAFAALLAVLLGALYPRLRGFCWIMLGVVCLARVQSGAHFPSDVLFGAGLAIALAAPIIHGYWGVRLLDAAWIRLVDPRATPAYPRVRRACEAHAPPGA